MKLIIEVPDFADEATAQAFVATLRGDLGEFAQIVGVVREELITDWQHVPVVKLDPPLPCSRWEGERWCGQPAALATVEGSLGGEVIIAPICRTCAVGGLEMLGGEMKTPPTA